MSETATINYKMPVPPVIILVKHFATRFSLDFIKFFPIIIITLFNSFDF